MTIDDLTRLAMREAQDFRNKMLVTGQPYSPHDEYYVFTRSIVRALRDEMTLGWEDDRPWGDVADVKKFLNKILASDGEEAAGGSTREDEKAVEAAGDKGPVSVNSPATDAAPAVCVWTGEEYVTYSTSCESEHEVDPHKAPPTYCPSCGKPIRFTEAK